MQSDLSLSVDDKATLRRLAVALKPFAQLSDRVPLSIVTTFLGVALSEGKSTGEYARAHGHSHSQATKLFADLGEVNRWQKEGHRLIVAQKDGSVSRSYLSTAGRALAWSCREDVGASEGDATRSLR